MALVTSNEYANIKLARTKLSSKNKHTSRVKREDKTGYPLESSGSESVQNEAESS